MFAFSIYNKKTKQIIIARDRFGEKPLYYNKSNNEIIWSSELKSIIVQKPELKKISSDSLQLFLSLSYIPAPYTIYEDIYKLEPGCSMIINTETLDFNIYKYWNIKPGESKNKIESYSHATKQLKSLLFDSIEKRMIADVPVGVFLSGGVDSSIIATAMSKISNQKIKTFTVAYKNKRYDESVRAAIIAKHVNSEHFECILNYDELINYYFS
jgi:asparagine synthase (glutamine-hydrolysing)